MKEIKKETVLIWIDGLMEFALCFLVFTLPFSKSFLEGAAITLISLWFIKRIICYDKRDSFIKAFKPVKTELSLPVGVFVVIGFLSMLVSVSFYLSFEGFVCKLLEWVMVYFIVTELVNTRDKLIRVLIVLFFSMVTMALDGIFQSVTGTDLLRGRSIAGCRVSSAFHNPNEFAGWLVMVIPVALSFACFSKRNWFSVFQKLSWIKNIVKPILWGLLVLLIACLTLTYTRSAWIAAGVSIIFLGLFKSKKLIICFLIILLITPFALPDSIKERAASIRTVTEESNVRSKLWLEALDIVEDFPVLGSGLNTYAYISPGYDISGKGGRYPHNSYLHMAAEMGVLGLGAFIWILIIFFKTSIKSLKKTGDNLYSITLAGLLAGFLGFMIHSFTDTNMYSLQLSILMWLIMGLTIAVKRIDLATSLSE